MRDVRTTTIFLFLVIFLWYGCSKEEESLPPVQPIKIVKPIKMPVPQKIETPSINQEVKPKPEEKEVEEINIATAEKKEEKRLESVFSEPQAQVARAEKFKEIKDIQFSKTSKGEDMVTFILNGNYPPQIFPTKKGKPRVVCDFFDASVRRSIRHQIKVNGNSIQQIRIGLHEGPNSKVRVVLDLAPYQNVDYQIQPVLFKDKHLFAIVVRKIQQPKNITKQTTNN